MEIINIIVKTNSGKKDIVKENNKFKVFIKALPEKGAANREIIKIFKKKLKKNVRIIRGFKSKEKVLEVID